jgi:hypothetical protein
MGYGGRFPRRMGTLRQKPDDEPRVQPRSDTQFRTMGIAVDTFTAQRHHEFSGLTESYRPGSRLERVPQAGADKFNIVNMLGPWTDMAKSISSAVAANALYRAAKASAEGKATARTRRE